MILRHLVLEKMCKLCFLKFHVDNMVMGFRFAFQLVNNFVYLLIFVNEIYYYMMLRFVLFVMVDQNSNYCFVDLC